MYVKIGISKAEPMKPSRIIIYVIVYDIVSFRLLTTKMMVSSNVYIEY